MLNDAQKFVQAVCDLSTTDGEVAIVGIAGKGCSGKSSLTARVGEIPGLDSQVISIDHWFEDRVTYNFRLNAARSLGNQELVAHIEDPKNRVDWLRLKSDLRRWFSAGAIELHEMYDKKNKGQRTLDVALRVPQRKPGLIIIEGMHLLDGFLRELLDYVVLLDIPSDVLLDRRLKRECADKTPEQIIARHEADERHVNDYFNDPAHKKPDLVLSLEDLQRTRDIIETLSFERFAPAERLALAPRRTGMVIRAAAG